MQQAKSGARHYGMDWLRIGAFGLLIFYHIGMFFVPWDWHVKARVTPDWVTLPMHFTNAWRLSLLFLVSGYASAAILTRKDSLGAFLKDRSKRLLVPLLFGVAFVVPPQPWVELMAKHGYAQGFGHFWLHDYFRFGTLDGIVLPTWQHLWFVVYLFLYTFALAGLLALPRGWRERCGRAIAALLARPAAMLLVPLAWLVLVKAVLWPGVGEKHDVASDLPAHCIYFAMLCLGYALRRYPQSWGAIRRSWRPALAIGLVGYCGIVAGDLAYPGSTPVPDRLLAPFGVARAMQGWGTILGLLGIADAFWNRDHRWRSVLNEAVFPAYSVHQTIIVVVGWWMLRWQVPNLPAFAILVAATVAGCALFYLLGREIRPLRTVIGLRAIAPALPAARA